MLVTASHQLDQDVFVSFDKEALKQIASVATHPLFSNEANWVMVSIVFKHNNSIKRLVSGFKNDFTKTDNVKVQPDMIGGEVYELHEILISGTDRQPILSIDRSEIANASSMDLTLADGAVSNPVTVTLSTTTNNVTNPFEVSVLFSEPVTGFELSDLTATNLFLSNLSGSGASYTLTASPLWNYLGSYDLGSSYAVGDVVEYGNELFYRIHANGGNVGDTPYDGSMFWNLLATNSNLSTSIQLPIDKASSASGIQNNASNTLSVTYYTPVSVSLSSNSSADVLNSFSATATFASEVTGFSLDDLSVNNCTVSNLSGSGTTYTFDVTPSSAGSMTLQISSGSAQNTHGASSLASNTLSRYYIAPISVILTSSSIGSNVYAPFSVTATFQDSVTGFSQSSLSVVNATVSNFSGSGSIYTFTITPTSTGSVSVQVPSSSAYSPATSAQNSASNTVSFQYYAPASVTLSSSAASTVTGGFTVTATFSEAVAGFALEDLNLVNCTASLLEALTTSSFQFYLTPTSEGSVSVQVKSNAVQTFAAGAGNTVSNTLSRAYYAPATVTLSTSSSSVTAAFSVSASFSKSVTGFALADISVTNGTASNLSGSGSNYTFDITPSAYGSVSAQINSATVSGANGENNSASNLLSVTYVAQTNLYVGVTGSNWNTASNWSLNSVPKVAGDIARFNNATTHTVNLDVDAILDKLYLDKQFETISSSSSKKLRFEGSNKQIIVGDAITWNLSPVISSALTVPTSLDVSGGALKITGLITASNATINNRSSDFRFTNTSNTFSGATINNYKNLYASSGSLAGISTINLYNSESAVDFGGSASNVALNLYGTTSNEIAISGNVTPTSLTSSTISGNITGTLRFFGGGPSQAVNLSGANASGLTFGSEAKILIDSYNNSGAQVRLPTNLNSNVKIQINKPDNTAPSTYYCMANLTSTTVNNPLDFCGATASSMYSYLVSDSATTLNGNIVLDPYGNSKAGTRLGIYSGAFTINSTISNGSAANAENYTFYIGGTGGVPTVTLQGTNSFTSPIYVEGGILKIKSVTQSNITAIGNLYLYSTNTGNVTLLSSGKLYGNNTGASINGNLSLNHTSTGIYTYDPAETTVANRSTHAVTVNGNLSCSVAAFTIYPSITSGNGSSKLTVNGNITASSITFTMGNAATAGTYKVLEYTGTWSGTPTFSVSGWTGTTVTHDTVAKTVTITKA